MQHHLARQSLAYASNFFLLVEEKSSLTEMLSVDVVFLIPLYLAELALRANYFMLIEVKYAF